MREAMSDRAVPSVAGQTRKITSRACPKDLIHAMRFSRRHLPVLFPQLVSLCGAQRWSSTFCSIAIQGFPARPPREKEKSGYHN